MRFACDDLDDDAPWGSLRVRGQDLRKSSGEHLEGTMPVLRSVRHSDWEVADQQPRMKTVSLQVRRRHAIPANAGSSRALGAPSPCAGPPRRRRARRRGRSGSACAGPYAGQSPHADEVSASRVYQDSSWVRLAVFQCSSNTEQPVVPVGFRYSESCQEPLNGSESPAFYARSLRARSQVPRDGRCYKPNAVTSSLPSRTSGVASDRISVRSRSFMENS